MSQSASTGTGSIAPGGLFTRNATGLVRELSAFDAFNLVFSAVLVPMGFMGIMAFAPVFWPHANLFLSLLIAGPLCACFGLVYLYFTVLMPRSGGDYVWVSRTLHPLLGFVVNVGFTYVFLTWVAFNFSLMINVLAPALAFVLNTNVGWLASPDKTEVLVVVSVLTALYAGLMVIGTKNVARFMAVSFVIVWIGIIAWAIIMAVGSNSGFISAWNGSQSVSYNDIIAKAGKLGFSNAGGISWTETLFAMTYAFNIYTGFQWTGYFAGEIKNVRRTATWSILGALVASVIGYVLLAFLVYQYYGQQFWGALTYLGLGGGAGNVSLGFAPYIPAMIKFLPVGQVVQVALVLCFILSVIWWTPAGYLLGTRNVFAWSFDRLAPAQLNKVSDRFHTPVAATIFIAVVIEVLNLLNLYSNLAAWLLSVIWVLGIGFIIVGIAAAILPWRRPELHALAPGWAKAKLAGVPVITMVSVIAILAWVFVTWAAFYTGSGGTFGFLPIVESGAVPIFAIVWYIGVSLYRRQQGVPMGKLFATIPPE